MPIHAIRGRVLEVTLGERPLSQHTRRTKGTGGHNDCVSCAIFDFPLDYLREAFVDSTVFFPLCRGTTGTGPDPIENEQFMSASEGMSSGLVVEFFDGSELLSLASDWASYSVPAS